MKKIALLIPAIFLMSVMNAQWTDNGNNITTSDNVGIGTTSPQHKMEVYGSNNAIGVGLTNYGWANANLIGAEYGAWDNSRTNATGTYFYRWTGSSTLYHLGYIGQELNNGHWGLAFKTDASSLKTHATSTRMFINTAGNVGIGTVNPSSKLHIKDTGSAIFRISNDNYFSEFGQNSAGGFLMLTDNSGTTNSLLRSYGDTYLNASTGNVGIGTTSPDAKLAVNGNIHTKEVKVDLVGWPDYVFEKEYNLPSLEEVETHIEENGHLQDIPSAEEVEENGIKLGEMDSKLLQKIEELMLYTIQQQKEIKKLREQHIQLLADVQALKQNTHK